jgi:uncharacterized membrane protein YhaH (DUF805 family)
MNTFIHASLAGFKRCFDFNGRSSRSDFWYFMLLFILLYMVVAVVDQTFITAKVDIRNLPLGRYVPMGMVDPNVLVGAPISAGHGLAHHGCLRQAVA